ncbi:hypothetical protein WJ49_22700 [Burkholderia ubonensis]|nr:hypothetical protein WJ49_22700 [Burkholderia ubonensis]KVL73190.1 hypothetical protein WJ48_00395 [Burkholderia ubonensis]
MLCWNLYSGEVALVPWPDREGLSRPYERSALACYAEVRDMSVAQRQAHVLSEAIGLIVRDHCNPRAVHDALLGLVEYRDSIPPDMGEPSAQLDDALQRHLDRRYLDRR